MLLSYLKHISIRIWIALLLGGGVSLLVLPLLQSRIGLANNIWVAAALLLLFFFVVGRVLNRWAMNQAEYLIAEAGALERDGLYPEAENSFQKAVAIIDSFMISPAARRKKTARLARFYMNRSGGDASAEKFLAAYLKSHPPQTRKKSNLTARVKQVVRAIYFYPASVAQWLVYGCKKAAGLVRNSRRTRQFLAGTLIFGLALGIGALVMNTVRHLAVQEASTEKAAASPVNVTTDPFTLQVAAYLKPEYARAYIRQLKKRGVDAYWSEAVRGDKKWYQVRVSHFATKQAAREYGQRLKAEGIIDDYYVANYRRH